MPYNCAVPQCNSVSNKNRSIKFHQFPRNKILKKKWLIAIKSGKKPSRHAKVCSLHFKDDDYKVTSMGNWKILNYKNAIPSSNLPKRKFDKVQSTSRKTIYYKTKQEADVEAVVSKENCLETIKETTEKPAIENIEMDRNTAKVDIHSRGTQTIQSFNGSQLISFNFLFDKQLKHFSGFQRHEFITICLFFKGSIHLNDSLSLEDQLLLTFMKYRHNFYYKTLQMFFDIDERTVSKIMTKWTYHIYNKLKSLDIWATKTKRSAHEYDVVIDCTEIEVERSLDPIIQEATYSNYYGTNTFKVLVGCTEYGAIIYVSKAYGGAISDRKLVQDCGFIDLLTEGEYILADRGFDISDLLEVKKVCLNTPPFKRKKQLSQDDVAKTRAIAHRRIIIENINALAKKNKILVDRMAHHLWNLADEIIYNCYMLQNFRNSIVK